MKLKNWNNFSINEDTKDNDVKYTKSQMIKFANDFKSNILQKELEVQKHI